MNSSGKVSNTVTLTVAASELRAPIESRRTGSAVVHRR